MMKEELRGENEELRRRLDEAQDALAAIRGGQVDAIVVEGDAGAQVFSLTGVETVYRLLVETMYEGAVTISKDGAIQYCNKRFRDLMRTPDSSLLGRPLWNFVAESQRDELASILLNVQAGPVQKRMDFFAADKTRVPVQLAAVMLQAGDTENACIVISDLTELEASAQTLAELRKHQEEMDAAQRQLRESRTAALNLMEDALASKRALEESEERLRFAQDSAGIGTWVWNIPTGNLEWSGELFRLFGVDSSCAEASFDTWRKLLHPDDLIVAGERIDAAVKNRALLDSEYRIVPAGGGVRWIRAIGRTQYDSVGLPLLMSGICMDITGRKRHEEHLRKEHSETLLANRVLRIFIEATGDELFDKALTAILEGTGSRHGVLGYISEPGHLICPSLSAMLATCEVEGKCIHYPPEKWKGLWARALREKRSLFTNEAQAVPRGHVAIDGNLATPIVFQDQVVGLLNQANKMGGYTDDDREFADGIARRIAPVLYAWIQKELRETEREKMLEEQKNALKRYEFLALTASGLLQVRDMEEAITLLCNKVLQFLDCHVFFNFLLDTGTGNLRLNAWAGIETDDAKKRATLDLGEALSGDAAREGRRMVIDHIQDSSDERVGLVRSFGVRAYCAFPLIGPDGRVMGTLSFGTRSRDVFSGEDLALMQAAANQVAIAMVRMKSERELKEYRFSLEKLVEQRTAELRNSQEQLLHAQKMEALGQLAGGIAHDFNNMMQVVIGYAHRTLRKLDFENPLRDNIEHIGQAAKSAATLTHRLLAFSRRQMLQPEVLSLNDLIIKIKPLLRHTLGEDVEVSYDLQQELGHVKADPVQLEQVIVNLAVNGRNAMPDGGKLEFQTADVTLGDSHPYGKDPVAPGPYVMLAISDTGCGMDKTTMEKIFEPFFTTRPFGAGSGLGLSTAYGTIRQSAGAIRVYSEPGKGTTFKIYLPQCKEKIRAGSPDGAGSSGREAGKTILVAEDNHMAREFVSLELGDLGYHVLAASGADKAISLSRSHTGPIDLLLSDVVLPGASGWEVSKVLSAERPEMVTLYMSGYDADNSIKQGKLMAGARLLAKPFSPEQLAAAVREALISGPSSRKARRGKPVSPVSNNGKAEPLRILVVDDDSGIAEIIAEILRETGDIVKSAENGATALTIAGELIPDVVLLDIRLPDMDGYELSRRIRALSDGSNPYIIAVSGLTPEHEPGGDGFDDYIAKPIDFTRLREMIDGRLKKRPATVG
ncbi:MAG: GAF domain-containing protein [Chitinispirillaceae bacterium]|nr:GAF domain-containing protein [Chitinispirillaceae bacterium]